LPRRRRVHPIPSRLLAAGIVAAATAAGIAAFLLLTPHDHAAPGCWWWTATRAGDVKPGDRGCLRGYYRGGASIAEGQSPTDHAVAILYAPPDEPAGRAACPFTAGDAVVVRYHAIFDDGRTIAIVEDCR
jgi:hypothetical protein